MTDISIGKSIKKSDVKARKFQNGEFAKLKKEYDAFIKKAAKSDLANSPVMKEKELELLSLLKSAAQKQQLEDDTKWIDEKINMLSGEKQTYQALSNVAYYSPASFKGSSVEEKYFREKACNPNIMAELKNSDGIIDEKTQRIIDSFSGRDRDLYNISYVVKKCRDEEGNIPEGAVKTVELLAASKIQPSYIAQMFDEYASDDFDGGINPDVCKKMLDFKLAGFDDVEAGKFTRLLADNFKDEAAVITSIMKMHKMNIKSDSIVKILDALTVKDPETGEKVISQKAVNSVVSLKKAMTLTRSNEKQERDNPINHLGVTIFRSPGNVMVFKNNHVTYHTPVEGESVHNLRKEYDDLVSKQEDRLLLEYAQKYKNADGEIDAKYLRIMTQLRRFGLPYDQLFNMTDFCVDKNGEINQEKLSTIGILKSSGVLGIDILPMLSVIGKAPDGTYDKEDIANACDLTSTVLPGKEVVSILPEVKGRENVKEFFMYFSPILDKKANVTALLPLIKLSDGSFDENAMDTLYSLAQNFFVSANGSMKEEDFMQNATAILSAAKNTGEETIEDDAAGICSILCQNRETPENIIKLLEESKTTDGVVDDKLAEIIWDMAFRNSTSEDIEFVLGLCRTEDGNINYKKTDKVISMFEEDASKDDVIDFLTSEI